jgi:hypothetical protein
MDAFVAKASLQLWYLEIVHSCPKDKFSYFYVHKVSEVLCKTPINQFGSNRVEWTLLNFGTPEIVLSGPKHKFSLFCMHKISEVLRYSHIYHFGSNEVEWMLHIFVAPN